jgi:tRNA A37 N6-isopentenylltransferase MiaA
METETSPENQEPAADITKMDTNEGEAQEGDKAAAATTQPSQPKQIVKAVDLQVESKTSSFTQQKIQELTEREVSFFFLANNLKTMF